MTDDQEHAGEMFDDVKRKLFNQEQPHPLSGQTVWPWPKPGIGPVKGKAHASPAKPGAHRGRPPSRSPRRSAARAKKGPFQGVAGWY